MTTTAPPIECAAPVLSQDMTTEPGPALSKARLFHYDNSQAQQANWKIAVDNHLEAAHPRGPRRERIREQAGVTRTR